MELPEWMRARTPPDAWEESPLPPGTSGGRWGHRLLRKAVGEFSGLLEDIARNNAVTERLGYLQSLDSRAKVLAFLALILAASFAHKSASLALLLAGGLLLAWASKIPLRMLMRVCLAAPLLSALVILPATLNIVTPGDAVATLWSLPSGWKLTITSPGLQVAGRFLLRLLTCVLLGLLLTATTPPHRLFRGLRALGVPALFVMLLSMMGRYLSLLARIAEELHLARISRSIVFVSTFREQTWVASGMGELFRRTYRLSDKVHLAMISRGYTGETRLLEEPRWRGRDWMAVALSSIVALAITFYDRSPFPHTSTAQTSHAASL